MSTVSELGSPGVKGTHAHNSLRSRGWLVGYRWVCWAWTMPLAS